MDNCTPGFRSPTVSLILPKPQSKKDVQLVSRVSEQEQLDLGVGEGASGNFSASPHQLSESLKEMSDQLNPIQDQLDSLLKEG